MQSAIIVATFTIGCAALAFILAVSTDNTEVVQILANSLLDTFKLGAGAVIALIGEGGKPPLNAKLLDILPGHNQDAIAHRPSREI
jgi:hypothetical protein